MACQFLLGWKPPLPILSGVGQVRLATDTQLNRDVALKSLSDAFAADPDRLARCQREAQRTHDGFCIGDCNRAARLAGALAAPPTTVSEAGRPC